MKTTFAPAEMYFRHVQEQIRRQEFLKAVNTAYVMLRKDAVIWKSIETERELWDVTLADGLMATCPEKRKQFDSA